MPGGVGRQEFTLERAYKCTYPIAVIGGGGGARMNGYFSRVKIYVQTWGYVFKDNVEVL